MTAQDLVDALAVGCLDIRVNDGARIDLAQVAEHPDRYPGYRPRTDHDLAVIDIPIGRATRGKSDPPSDAEIERGLRERAVSDPRAAEILLRWLQRVRPPEVTPGVDLDALSETQLERLHAGLVKLASLNGAVLAALVEHVFGDDEPASSS